MDKNSERLGRLRPEEKVLICMDMTDGCIRICADCIKDQFPDISDEELNTKLRAQVEWSKRKHLSWIAKPKQPFPACKIA